MSNIHYFRKSNFNLTHIAFTQKTKPLCIIVTIFSNSSVDDASMSTQGTFDKYLTLSLICYIQYLSNLAKPWI